MKTEIHPEYVLAHVTCSCGNEFTTRSTKPELHVEVCSHCHPFYTGKQKLMDAGGRVERFQRRLEKAGGPRRGYGSWPLSVSYGGQAVLEGVMMRGPASGPSPFARPSGEIVEVTKSVDSRRCNAIGVYRLPVIRGVVALGESLAIGFRALAISANYAMQEEPEEGAEDAGGGLDRDLARRRSIVSFVGRDRLCARALQGRAGAAHRAGCRSTAPYSFVVVEGLIRVDVFVALHRPDRAAARPEARVPVPRGRAQGDQRARGRLRADAGEGAEVSA